MREFSGKRARTNEPTYGGESKGPSTPSRDQKSEKQIFYPERDFSSVEFFQLKTILNQSEEKSKNRII